MTTPSDSESGQPPREGVDLGQADPAADAPFDPVADAPFDPYRYGRPDHPIPAEYAPPGYTGPTAPAASPYGPPSGPYGAPAPGSSAPNPFNNPPGTPYSGPQYPYPQQYPTPGYGPGVPPPPSFHGYAQPRTGNGKAIAALVLGICSIVFCWLSVFDAVFVIVGLVFGLLALREARQGRAGGRGMAVAALCCVVVGAVLATIISITVFRAIGKCGGIDQSSTSTFNHCVRDHI